MFWKRKRATVPDAVAPIVPWEQTETNRALRDQQSWPSNPWPVATAEDQRLLLEAQISIDSRYAERWPLKTHANLVLLRNASRQGNIPLDQVIMYLKVLTVAEAIAAIQQGLPLEYATALKGTL